MTNVFTQVQHRTDGIARAACVAAMGLAFTLALPHAARAERITPPPVPTDVEVPEQTSLLFVGHGVGTQNYVCVPSGNRVAFVLFTPQATLFADDNRQITTHFFSPNPDEAGIVRVTWEDSNDTSTVWGKVTGQSSDARFVAPGAVAWLRVEIVGKREGPTGGGRLLRTSFVQRLNTVGGLAPSTGCATSRDIGTKAFMPYTADYFFYETLSPGDDNR